MATTITLAQLEDRVLRRMNEANNSPAAELSAGTSNTPTATTTAGITDFADEGIADLCKRGFPLLGHFQKTSLTIGTREILLSELSPNTSSVPSTPSGCRCWLPLPTGVRYNSVRLEYVGFHKALLYDEDALTAASGTADMWTIAASREQIILLPPPSASQTLAVDGWMIPPAVSGSGAASAYIPDDLMISYVVPYVCWQICEKNKDNPNFAGRLMGFLEECEGVMATLQSRLDEDYKQWAYPFLLGG